MENNIIENISWKVIDKMFKSNPNFLVAHHLNSYNDFINVGIRKIFMENNPILFVEKEKENANECELYLGGVDGNKIYFGKPVIYDDENVHFMYPNEARLRNMTYGITIHYDVDVNFVVKDTESGEIMKQTMVIEKVLLGKFPIMTQSDVCILNQFDRLVKFEMGECKNDYGGYFIIDGKEKVIVCQEKFADNMLNIKQNNIDDVHAVTCSIRSVSEDTSKPIRTTRIHVERQFGQIVVEIPNVRFQIPLFILMRALGITSDKEIIQYCLLNLEHNEKYIDMFASSIHDARKCFNQHLALKYIAPFVKRGTVMSVMEILSDYFLPHVGELNFIQKAYFVGHMVFETIKVHNGDEVETDRDSFKFKRIELSGTLFYNLFREYYLLQKNDIYQKISKEYYFHQGEYQRQDINKNVGEGAGDMNTFISLIELNRNKFFKDRIVETGVRKALKGNWGSSPHTRKVGVVQDLNRLSRNSYLSQLRKTNLPMNSSAKVTGPHLLNGTQWGYIDPIDTPDGGNVGLHKHLSIAAHITCHSSGQLMENWLRTETPMKINVECLPEYISNCSKIFVNGGWVGVIENPIEVIDKMRVFRRNGLIPVFTSISFDYKKKIVNIYTDGGRLTRPIYFIENGKVSYERDLIRQKIYNDETTWTNLVSGFNEKSDKKFNIIKNKIYNINELYSKLKIDNDLLNNLLKNSSIIEFMDTSEEESSLIAMTTEDMKNSKYYTHLEIESSLVLGVMGNQVIFPENNPATRDLFFCGQSRQAVSCFHSNHQVRIDKMSVVLNYGQSPLIKSRYLKYMGNEEHPYGVNTIVAIMSYSGYNVEDAILVNKGAIERGLFNTTYFTMYEGHEEVNNETHSKFANIEKNNVSGLKQGYDYSMLDDNGLVKENTEITDKTILIGKINANFEKDGEWVDSSIKTKKGQLGFIDKVFVTDGEEGHNIAKIRIREDRIPALGDKMGSRAGQKGTVGLIISEHDMPFTEDGIRPDIIINPHAIPSRMTVGQIIEALFGKVCTHKGIFGDCTAFQTKGSNITTYGKHLLDAGFHSSGNEILHDAITGEQLDANIFIGPTYYMRLKHMVKDKINYRARGPVTMLTRQSVHGRANDGGLRIGEMERDSILSHGMSSFLKDSFLNRCDEFHIAICNTSGNIAIYNNSRDVFLSPSADGPLKFIDDLDGSQKVKNISKFGRSFSILKVPYSFKLILQELQVMNIQMKIITDDNVNKIMGLSYSDNAYKILNIKEGEEISARRIYKENFRAYYNEAVYKDINPVTDVHYDIPSTPVLNDDESTVRVEYNENKSNKPEIVDDSTKNGSTASLEYASDSSTYMPDSLEDDENKTSEPEILEDSAAKDIEILDENENKTKTIPPFEINPSFGENNENNENEANEDYLTNNKIIINSDTITPLQTPPATILDIDEIVEEDNNNDDDKDKEKNDETNTKRITLSADITDIK